MWRTRHKRRANKQSTEVSAALAADMHVIHSCWFLFYNCVWKKHAVHHYTTKQGFEGETLSLDNRVMAFHIQYKLYKINLQDSSPKIYQTYTVSTRNDYVQSGSDVLHSTADPHPFVTTVTWVTPQTDLQAILITIKYLSFLIARLLLKVLDCATAFQYRTKWDEVAASCIIKAFILLH